MFEEKYVDHKKVYVWKTGERLRRARHFLGRFFSWRNLAHAFRAVTGGFREYLPFYIACFAVQLIFWSGIFYSDTIMETSRAEAYAAADCHVVVDGLSNYEKTVIENGKLWVNQHLEPEERMYESYEFFGYTDGLGDKRYEMRILLDEDSSERADDFLSYYSIGGEATHTYYTERITVIEAAKTKAGTVRTVFFLLSLAFAAAALLILFNIRTNHYKFRYGIYMSFGAGFEKLFETASWELFMISLLTFIPSLAAGLGISALAYLPRGAGFCFRLADLLLALLWDLLAVFIGVFPPVLALSKKRPVQLLAAEDNSNLVSSPRRSAYIFGKKFPETYELYGMIRFRRYFAGLLLGAVSFSTVFLCGIFFRDRQANIQSAPEAQFGMTVPGGIDEVDLDLAGDIEGVDYLMWENATDAAGWRSHVVLTSGQAGSRSFVSTKAQDGQNIATNSFRFSALDEDMLDIAEAHGLWDVAGDLRSVLTDEYTVAVSNYIFNTKELNIKVGDKIKLALFDSADAPLDSSLTDPRLILQQQIKYGRFNYIEVTVGAVVDTGAADDAFMIGVSPELYAEITGKAPVTEFANVYLKQDLSYKESLEVLRELRKLISLDSSYMIYDYQTQARSAVENATDVGGVTLICALAALLLSPLVWFFSQSMFFAKREGEFYMLQSFGATDAKIKKLHLFSGGVLAASAFAASILLSSAAGYLMFMLLDNWLPKYGFIQAVRYSFSLPPAASAACLAVSMACGFASSLLPFRAYIKKRERIERTQLGE